MPLHSTCRLSLFSFAVLSFSACITASSSAPDAELTDVATESETSGVSPDVVPAEDVRADVTELDAEPDAEPDAEQDVPAPDVSADGPEDMGPSTECGNGELEEGEGCDDGNVRGGDGCGPSCKREVDFICAPCGTDDSACGGETDLCIEGACAADCRDWPCPAEHTCQEVVDRPVIQHQCVPDIGCGTGVEECDNGADDDGDTRVDCDDTDCAAAPVCNVVGGPGSCDEPEVASLGRHTFVPREDIRSPSCLTTADQEAVFIFRPIEVTTYCFDTRSSEADDTVLSIRSDCFDAESEELCVDDVWEPELDFRAWSEWEASSMSPVFVIVDVYGAEDAQNVRLEISRGACPEPEPEPDPEP